MSGKLASVGGNRKARHKRAMRMWPQRDLFHKQMRRAFRRKPRGHWPAWANQNPKLFWPEMFMSKVEDASSWEYNLGVVWNDPAAEMQGLPIEVSQR